MCSYVCGMLHLNLLEHLFLHLSPIAVLFHHESCICPDWASSLWLLGLLAGFLHRWLVLGWLPQLVTVWGVMGAGRPAQAGSARVGRLPVSRSATKRSHQDPNLFSPPSSGMVGPGTAIQHLVGLFSGGESDPLMWGHRMIFPPW